MTVSQGLFATAAVLFVLALAMGLLTIDTKGQLLRNYARFGYTFLGTSATCAIIAIWLAVAGL